ncbi:MAG: methyltransferase domain-containing protein [Pirellulaceae bacterium]|nr:methyltransferase domain-containing protein [Pirellulaceae bacterium]
MSKTQWDAGLYDGKHAFVSQLGAGVLELLAPQAGERILDVGCGTGHLTSKIALSGAEVVGLDSSSEMIAQANRLYPHIQFIEADISKYHGQPTFDAIFSNAALHWVHRAEQAAQCMAALLKPAGRLVVEFGGRGNVQRIVGALQDVILEMTGQPVSAENYFPSISQYTGLLEQTGFEVRSAELFDRPTRLEDARHGLQNWLRMFRHQTLASVPVELWPELMIRIESRVRDSLWRDGAWWADYRRLRIVALRTAYSSPPETAIRAQATI